MKIQNLKWAGGKTQIIDDVISNLLKLTIITKYF